MILSLPIVLKGVFFYKSSIFVDKQRITVLEPTDPSNRQPGRFAGFSLYVSDIDLSSVSDIKLSTRCYTDGPQLPPLNFTTVCKVYGRYVIYYNERFNDVTYPEEYETNNVITELCEVVVKGKMYIVLSMN